MSKSGFLYLNSLAISTRQSIVDILSKRYDDVEINVSPHGDYPYRAFVEPAVFTEWVAEHANEIDYDNFKNQVAKTRGYDFVDALHNVWVAMLGVEHSSREELKRMGESNGSV